MSKSVTEVNRVALHLDANGEKVYPDKSGHPC